MGSIIPATVNRGQDIPTGNTHADYIDKSGYYNILKHLQENQDEWPSISNVGIGQVCAHSTDEVACKSLFSDANYAAAAK
mmetsp:Transcript_24473/g.39835  ORF Transcript_24473/g.39835 Transcript_24473/m.39835 type:complete len:80 (+) Transcript_24473:321-560(+)